MKNNEFSADVMAETVRRSSLGALRDGSYVNLERAMAADGRFGGHIVSGHIDGTGQIESMRREENAVWVTIACTDKILDLIVEKGSICIDGISLTVAAVTKRNFSVSVIPHTGEETTLLKKKAGEPVNLENDIVGKYIQKFVDIGRNSGADRGKMPDGENAAGNAKGNSGAQHGVSSDIWILKHRLEGKIPSAMLIGNGFLRVTMKVLNSYENF